MRKILFSFYSLGGLVALAGNLQQLLATRITGNAMVAAVLENLGLSIAIATKAIGIVNRKPLTKLIRQADKIRDNHFRAFKSLIINGTRRNNAEYREACMALTHIIEKNNPMLHELGYQEETAAINSLLRDLDEEPAKTWVAAANIQDWVQELAQANQDFISAFESRSVAAATDDTLTDREAFAKLETSMKLVCSVLDSHLGYGEPEDIQDIVNLANQYIREANTAARLSGPRGDDDEEE